MMPQLRQNILTAIAVHWQEHGYGPSVRDLQAATGGHSTSVIAYNIDALITKDLVTKDSGRARSLRLTEEGRKYITDKSEIAVLERLLAERNRVLDAIPACPEHGSQCVPHALEWIAESVQMRFDIWNKKV